MNSSWRLVWVCLLAVALPLKAWALVAMPCCQLVTATVSMAGVSAVSAPPPCHDVSQAVAHAPDDGGSHAQNKVAMSCAVCMSAAPTALSIPNLSLSPTSMFAGRAVLNDFVTITYVSHVPDDVDRPPQQARA
jgi:hypothetical protein